MPAPITPALPFICQGDIWLFQITEPWKTQVSHASAVPAWVDWYKSPSQSDMRFAVFTKWQGWSDIPASTETFPLKKYFPWPLDRATPTLETQTQSNFSWDTNWQEIISGMHGHSSLTWTAFLWCQCRNSHCASSGHASKKTKRKCRWDLLLKFRDNEENNPHLIGRHYKSMCSLTPPSTVFFTSIEKVPVLLFTIAFRSWKIKHFKKHIEQRGRGWVTAAHWMQLPFN